MLRTQMGLTQWLTLVMLSLLWGASFLFIEIALNGIPTLTIVAMRVSIAAILIWALVIALGYPVPKQPVVWLSFLFMGAMNNALPFVLIVWGQTEISGSLAAILNAATPIFTVFVAGLFLRDEPITRASLGGSLVGLAGVVVLVGPNALAGITSHLLAQLAVLGGALAYAFAGVFGRRFRTLGITPTVASAGQLLAASLIMIPVAIFIDRPFALDAPPASALAAVLGLAVLSTALAYLLYFRLLETAGVTNLMLVTLLIPVTAIFLGWLVLDEQLKAFHFAGMAIVGFGLSIIDGRLWRRRAQAT